MESEKTDGVLNNITINMGDDAGNSNPRTTESLEHGRNGSPHGFAKYITLGIQRCMQKFLKISLSTALLMIFLEILPRQHHWAAWVGCVVFLLDIACIIWE